MEEVVQYVCAVRSGLPVEPVTVLDSSVLVFCETAFAWSGVRVGISSSVPCGRRAHNAISVKREVFRAWCVSCVSCVVSRVGRGRGQLLQSCRGLLYDLSLSLP